MLVERCLRVGQNRPMRKLFALPDDAVHAPRRGRVVCQLVPSFLVRRRLYRQRDHDRQKCRLAFSHGCLAPRRFVDDCQAGILATLGVRKSPQENSLFTIDGLPKLLQAKLEGDDLGAWPQTRAFWYGWPLWFCWWWLAAAAGGSSAATAGMSLSPAQARPPGQGISTSQ